jgi:putative SOS response-associated peptidase YedK
VGNGGSLLDKTEGKKKLPFRFTLKDDSIFAFPAIYDEPDVDAKPKPSDKHSPPLPTFCIFTTEANPLVAPIHHRQPAILPPDLEDTWLDEGLTDIQKIVGMLKPYPESAMKSWAVSTAINSGKVEGPELVNPI